QDVGTGHGAAEFAKRRCCSPRALEDRPYRHLGLKPERCAVWTCASLSGVRIYASRAVLHCGIYFDALLFLFSSTPSPNAVMCAIDDVLLSRAPACTIHS